MNGKFESYVNKRRRFLDKFVVSFQYFILSDIKIWMVIIKSIYILYGTKLSLSKYVVSYLNLIAFAIKPMFMLYLCQLYITKRCSNTFGVHCTREYKLLFEIPNFENFIFFPMSSCQLFKTLINSRHYFYILYIRIGIVLSIFI